MQNTENPTSCQERSQEQNNFYLKILNIVGPIASLALVTLPFVFYYLARKPHYLPVGATFRSNQQIVQLEVATKAEDYLHGLKFRHSMPENTGMLFILKNKENIKLWMKDTYIPLDMIFLSDGVIKTIVEAAPPCKTQVCPKYDSVYPVNYIIELPAGSVKSLNLYVNKKIKIAQ